MDSIKAWIRRTDVHHRVALASTVGFFVFLASAGRMLPETRAVLGWNAGAACYLLLAWVIMAQADAHATRLSTLNQRQSGTAVLAVVVVAGCISLAALALLFKQSRGLHGGSLFGHVLLSALALGASWMLIHTRFAFHYAHRYYVGTPAHPDERGGIAFPGNREPDYLDFAYFSFVIGMTSQVSDVAVTTRTMRRLTLIHGLLSFAFNVVVLALSVNILASLV